MWVESTNVRDVELPQLNGMVLVIEFSHRFRRMLIHLCRLSNCGCVAQKLHLPWRFHGSCRAGGHFNVVEGAVFSSNMAEVAVKDLKFASPKHE